ncbi:SMP-30/gluconolactonase/LRE family protein [Streptomyces sp. SID13031]|uniref:SMP-30/gluconolactonase/LRE family protein n=1 Tax=Streptomyces sp. SID13031 TaxID=2706046 RepID=UPI0013CA94E3|nr:SMP-30/gluconolactonase/LRE family protein [Streptomyces sp. SID13031]NEA36530.1 SMP-30/gluconolactonase/LRE family protein [Streptomyces sp. SID13031]
MPLLEPLAGTVPAEWVRMDDRFAGIRGDSHLERLWTGGRWLEGPVYSAAGRYVLWSDIPSDRILRWDETSYQVSVFREPAGNSNGHTLDEQGRLVSCEHGNRRVTRTEHDGSVRVLADGYNGGRLNSPNDVVVGADGAVWFTDPAYGIDSDYEGHQGEIEVGGCHVYRLSPDGALTVVADDFNRPNGLAFSNDGSLLYITDTEEATIRVLTVDGGKLTGGDLFAECGNGAFDGIRLDSEGRVWGAAADGVHVYHPDGTLLGKLLVPETVSNLCFGGPKRNRLFLTATTSLYSLFTTVNGGRQPYDQSA